MKPEQDETTIRVCTPLGAFCGEFVFPTKALNQLEELNKRDEGYYFTYDTE